MAEFFRHGPGLGLFLNAGDPPLDALVEVLHMLDESGVDCVELAVPFPNSVSDGPVIRRSAGRALAAGVGLAETLAVVDEVSSRLTRLRIVLLADWRHTVKPLSDAEFAARVAESGAHGVLVHGSPPRHRNQLLERLGAAGVPVVGTCYARSTAAVQAAAARSATAYLYLVAHYGRSGGAPLALAGLRPAIAELRSRAAVPVALGFGIRTAEDVQRVHELGAAALVGTAAVERLERDGDPVRILEHFVHELSAKPILKGNNP